MTPEQKLWIDEATHQDIIDKIRTEPVDSEWFDGVCGDYLFNALKRSVRELMSQDTAVVEIFLSVPESEYVSAEPSIDASTQTSEKSGKKRNRVNK